MTLISNDANVPNDEHYGKGRLKATNAIVVHGEVLRNLSPVSLKEIVTNYVQVGGQLNLAFSTLANRFKYF